MGGMEDKRLHVRGRFFPKIFFGSLLLPLALAEAKDRKIPNGVQFRVAQGYTCAALLRLNWGASPQKKPSFFDDDSFNLLNQWIDTQVRGALRGRSFAKEKVSFEALIGESEPVISTVDLQKELARLEPSQAFLFLAGHLHQLSLEQLRQAHLFIKPGSDHRATGKVLDLLNRRIISMILIMEENMALDQLLSRLEFIERRLIEDRFSFGRFEGNPWSDLDRSRLEPAIIQEWDETSRAAAILSVRVEQGKSILTRGYRYPKRGSPVKQSARPVISQPELLEDFPELNSNRQASFQTLIQTEWNEPVFKTSEIERLLNQGARSQVQEFFFFHLHQLSRSQISYLMNRELPQWIETLLHERFEDFTLIDRIEAALQTYHDSLRWLEALMKDKNQKIPEEEFKRLIATLARGVTKNSLAHLKEYLTSFGRILKQELFRMDEDQFYQVALQVHRVLKEVDGITEEHLNPFIAALMGYSRTIWVPQKKVQNLFLQILGRSVEDKTRYWGTNENQLLSFWGNLGSEIDSTERILKELKRELPQGKLKMGLN